MNDNSTVKKWIAVLLLFGWCAPISISVSPKRIITFKVSFTWKPCPAERMYPTEKLPFSSINFGTTGFKNWHYWKRIVFDWLTLYKHLSHCTGFWYILYITVHHCTFHLTCTVQYWTTLYVLTDSYCTALNQKKLYRH